MEPCVPVGVRSRCSIEEVQRLADFVRAHAPRILVVSGAGISTERPSAIPDYRSNAHTRPKHTPITHAQFTTSQARRQKYWARSCVGYERVAGAAPNASHFALARLHREGWSGLLHVTQNVDGMLQRAAMEQQQLVELHGTVHKVSCLSCGRSVSRHEFQQKMMRENRAWVAAVREKYADHLARPDGDAKIDEADVESFSTPHCTSCTNGVMKPDVVFFGGAVPKHVKELAAEQVRKASAILVVGSTLTTYSAFGLVRTLVTENPRAEVTIITNGPTRADKLCTLKVDALIGSTLDAVLQALAK